MVEILGPSPQFITTSHTAEAQPLAAVASTGPGAVRSAEIIDFNLHRLSHNSLPGNHLFTKKMDDALPASTQNVVTQGRRKLPASARIGVALAANGEQLQPLVVEALKTYRAAWLRYESGTGAKPQPQIQISVPGIPNLSVQAYYTGALRWRERHLDPLSGDWTSSILGSIPEMSFARATAAHFKTQEDIALGISPGIGDRLTLDQAVIDHVFPNSERNGKKSLRNDEYRYPKHVGRLLGSMQLSELREAIIRRCVEEIRCLETPANAEKHVALVKFICRDLEALRLIAHNPAARIKMRQIENPVLVIPSDEQLAKLGQVLLSENPNINNDFILTLAFTGTRCRELRYALVADLDINRKVLVVRETKSSRIEEIHLSDPALTVLIRRKFLATGRYLFGSSRGDHPIGYPRHAFLKICERAGVSGITMHAFRRGFATACMQAPGVTSHDASKLLRHSSLRTTEKYYLVATNNRLQQAANAAGQAIAQRLGLDPKGRPYLRPTVCSVAMSDHIRRVAA